MKRVKTLSFVLFLLAMLAGSLLFWAGVLPPTVAGVLRIWMWPVLYMIGLITSAQAWRWSRKGAYWFFMVYFALAFYCATAAPYVNDWIQHKIERKVDPVVIEKRRQMQEEISAIQNKYELPPEMVAAVITLPVGQILLVAGLWFLARKEMSTEQAKDPHGSR